MGRKKEEAVSGQDKRGMELTSCGSCTPHGWERHSGKTATHEELSRLRRHGWLER